MAEEQKKTELKHEVTVEHVRAFPYYVDIEDPVSGKLMRQERIASRGETVKLSDADYERAKRFAIFTDPDAEDSSAGPKGAQGGVYDPNSMDLMQVTTEDVANWLRRSPKPTVDEVVEDANNDPNRARKLLDAENHATGQQPRATLRDRLQEIIGS